MGMLWFDKPAEEWSQALPIGNGRLGAMVSGGGKSEILQLNQDSIWYGGHIDRINPDAKFCQERFRKPRICSDTLFPERPEVSVLISHWEMWR